MHERQGVMGGGGSGARLGPQASGGAYSTSGLCFQQLYMSCGHSSSLCRTYSRGGQGLTQAARWQAARLQAARLQVARLQAAPLLPSAF